MLSALLIAGSVLAWSPQAGKIGARIEAAVRAGLAAEELGSLADEALAQAGAATSRADFWSALTHLGRLCEEGPRELVRPLRARALALLVEHESDTRRWSALMATRFVPPFERLEPSTWAQEAREYEAQLVALSETTQVARVKAELLHARVSWRVFIDRRWDWLPGEERERALALLTVLEDEYGTQLVPGGNRLDTDTLGARARRMRYELTALAFGAPAPSTKGIDLAGEPFDLGELRGSIVVLDFWTTFCQPCLALVPEARRILADLAGEPVVYVGVNGDPERELGARTAQRAGMPWRNLWDGPRGTEGPAATAWDVAAVGWPSLFVLDGQGRIRAKLRGREQVEGELERTLRALLAGKEGRKGCR